MTTAPGLNFTRLLLRPTGALGMALSMLFCVMLPGCSGCTDDAEQAEKAPKKPAKKPPKPKPDFEPLKLAVQPGGGGAAKDETGEMRRPVKPGHWTSASIEAKANNFDFQGVLDSTIVDPNKDQLNLERTPFRLETTRPAVLSKGQTKFLELTFFVPQGQTKTFLASQLKERRSGSEVKRADELLEHMPDFQYYLFVLAREPDRYRFLNVLDSVRPPLADFLDGGTEKQHYRVVIPQIKQRVGLPSQPLTWTSLAYLVWDDIEPSTLTPEQQQALVDWLHWGGQLIVSGPQTLDSLAGSFLDRYLPAKSTGAIELNNESFRDFNAAWIVPDGPRVSPPLTVTKPWAGVALQSQADGQFVPKTGALVAERRVGRGRVVVTAFRLSQRELVTWRSFDSFFNGCLLGRPPREFLGDEATGPQVRWKGDHDSQGMFNSRYNTALRYFTRHSGVAQQIKPPTAQTDAGQNSPFVNVPGTSKSFVEADTDGGVWSNMRRASGVGGWDDFGPVAEAARESLKEAAGITIPRREFVLWTLSLYLLVLVPLNGLLFWALGRVEWAWAAAPVIAVVCAVTVVYMAQLDIGFARSRTEIAVVEMQGIYPRAHVTRYSALYTSLSTSYDLRFAEPSALAQPFASEANFELVSKQARSTVTFRQDRDVELTDFKVSSNSTGMVHSEYMLDLAGGFSWEDAGQPRFVNESPLSLHGGIVVRKLKVSEPEVEDLEIAWVGPLAPRHSAALKFVSSFDEELRSELEQSVLSAAGRPKGALGLRRLIDLAKESSEFAPGDVRLIGWTEEALPGVDFQPAASQARQAALVIAHLAHGAGNPSGPDANTRRAALKREFEEEAKPAAAEPAAGS